MNKKKSKKEKEVIDKFNRDTKRMSSSQIIEYMKLSEVEKEKFVQRLRFEHGIKYISHDKDVDKNKIFILNRKYRWR